MPALKPEDADNLISQAISDGDIEAGLALYEPGASFVSEPGLVVTGTDAIRKVLEGFMALKPQITLEVEKVIQSGDLALLHARYTIKGTDAVGIPMEMTGKSAEVVRRQADGSWLFVIDNPFGTD